MSYMIPYWLAFLFAVGIMCMAVAPERIAAWLMDVLVRLEDERQQREQQERDEE